MRKYNTVTHIKKWMVEWSTCLSLGICTVRTNPVAYGPNKGNCNLTVNALSGQVSEFILIRRGHLWGVISIIFQNSPLLLERKRKYNVSWKVTKPHYFRIVSNVSLIPVAFLISETVSTDS